MCGIAGTIGSNLPAEHLGAVVQRMTDVISHRGPDDQGFYSEHSLAIGMRRLSIIDLEGGSQPISNEDGSVVIVFNGEIYNYRELRDELRARGHQLATCSPTFDACGSPVMRSASVTKMPRIHKTRDSQALQGEEQRYPIVPAATFSPLTKSVRDRSTAAVMNDFIKDLPWRTK